MCAIFVCSEKNFNQIDLYTVYYTPGPPPYTPSRKDAVSDSEVRSHICLIEICIWLRWLLNCFAQTIKLKHIQSAIENTWEFCGENEARVNAISTSLNISKSTKLFSRIY